MKAITVQQPWAWAIIHGGKTVENRTRIGTWRPAAGERVALHAGRRWSERGSNFEPLQRAYTAWLGFTDWTGPMGGHTALPIDPRTEERDRELLDFGAIIGTVDVVDVHPEQGGCCQPWGEQSYLEHGGSKRVDVVHLVLERPRALIVPEPCRGALGLWTVPDMTAAAVVDLDLGVHFGEAATQ